MAESEPPTGQRQPLAVELPMVTGPAPILLPPEPEERAAALRAALIGPSRVQELRALAGRWPAFVAAWAHLGEAAYRAEQDIEAYAFFRTAYHRGLDRLRQHGWRGAGPVPWAHRPNRGVLRAFRGLMVTSAAVGEVDEARRLRQLLLDSDPADPFGVGVLRAGDLQNRLLLVEPG